MRQNANFFKISLLLLVGLFVFLFIIANTVADVYYIVTDPVAGILYEFDAGTNQTIVEDVVRGGPAEKAGLKAGDVITKVDDRPLTKGEGLAEALRHVKVGESVNLTVVRDASQYRITLNTERRISVYAKGILFSILPGSVFCYTLCLIGVFVLLKKIEDRSAQLFYLMVIFWALAMRNTFSVGYFSFHSLLPQVLHWMVLPAWPLAVGLLFHFYLVFPIEKEMFKKHRKLLLTLIYLPLILIPAYAYGEIHGVPFKDKILDYGWGTWLTIYFVAAMASLRHSIRHSPNPHVKKQAQIMMWGTSISLGIPCLFYFVPNLLFQYKLPFGELIVLLIILWPFTLAYVIVKHRFMDIDVIVKRSLAYALMSGFVIAAYFLLVVGVGKLVLFLTGSRSQIVTIIATLLIAALFNPVKNRIRNFVDRRFFPSRFIYREAVRAFSHQLVKVVDLERLLQILQSFISERMKIKPVAILWRQKQGDIFTIRSFVGKIEQQAVSFSGQDVVVAKLQKKEQLIDLSPVKEEPELLTAGELSRWQALNAEIVLPLLFKRKLIGILSLGLKEMDEPYYKEDLELLESLTDQINISLENALLTEELREQDRLRHELEVARRIQLSSLPQADPQIPGLEISGISIPALEVGGDYYDYLDLSDGRFGIVVGDVSGKGTSAALYMSQLKGILKTASKYHRSLKDLLSEVNAITFRSMELQSYITLTLGAFDLNLKKLRLVRAGHLPLVYYSVREHKCFELTPKGIGVGLENGNIFDHEIEELEVPFQPGDVFLFYTDGIIEARDSYGDEFELNLASLLIENGSRSAFALREKIIAHVQQFASRNYQKDDMTLVVVRVV